MILLFYKDINEREYMEMYGKYNNKEERDNDRAEGRFLNKKKAVAKKSQKGRVDYISSDAELEDIFSNMV